MDLSLSLGCETKELCDYLRSKSTDQPNLDYVRVRGQSWPSCEAGWNEYFLGGEKGTDKTNVGLFLKFGGDYVGERASKL